MSVLNAKYNSVFAFIFNFRCFFVRFWCLFGYVCAVPRTSSWIYFLFLCFSVNILDICE